jgi:uncharacterized protein (TIGR02001 family)
MKRSTYAIALALAAPVLPGVAHADLAFNVGAVTDYRYRGISQSRLKPALQGGVDWSSGGLYVGAWASTIKWIKDADGGADVEIDLYGGYKGEIVKGVGYDVGILAYQYPGHDLPVSPNSTELYGAVTYGIFTFKYSHSVTDLFGVPDSNNSGYFDVSATVDLGDGWSLVPHIGKQRVEKNGQFAYWDYSLTVAKTIGSFTLTGAIVATDTDEYIGGDNKNLGKSGVVLGAKFSF